MEPKLTASRVTVRLDGVLRDAIDAYSKRTGLTVSASARTLLHTALAQEGEAITEAHLSAVREGLRVGTAKFRRKFQEFVSELLGELRSTGVVVPLRQVADAPEGDDDA